MLKNLSKTINALGGIVGEHVHLLQPTVPLAVFTRFADEIARIARTTEMSPIARQQLCEELEKTYAIIINKKAAEPLLYS